MIRFLAGLVFAIVLMCHAAPKPKAAFAEDGTQASPELHAYLLAFDKASVTVPSGANVSLTLFNDENYIAHNLAVDVPGVDPTKVCLGPCRTVLSFAAPDPGVYKFFCTLHPTMVGDLYVQ